MSDTFTLQDKYPQTYAGAEYQDKWDTMRLKGLTWTLIMYFKFFSCECYGLIRINKNPFSSWRCHCISISWFHLGFHVKYCSYHDFSTESVSPAHVQSCVHWPCGLFLSFRWPFSFLFYLSSCALFFGSKQTYFLTILLIVSGTLFNSFFISNIKYLIKLKETLNYSIYVWIVCSAIN